MITLKSNNIPKEIGQYIWKPRFGNQAQLVNIFFRPEEFMCGMKFGGFLAIDELRGKPVDNFTSDFWSDKLEYEIEN